MLLFIIGVVISYAQCDKKQVLTASKTEYLDRNGTVQRTADETTTVEFNKSDINITIFAGETKSMSGSIKSDTCNWKIPFKEGKSILKALLTDPKGDARNLTITIEGKDGALSFLAEVEDMPDRRIRLVVDKFEEKK